MFWITEKCAQYWPEEVDGHLAFDHVEVTTLDITETDDKEIVIRDLQIKSKILFYIHNTLDFKKWPSSNIVLL